MKPNHYKLFVFLLSVMLTACAFPSASSSAATFTASQETSPPSTENAGGQARATTVVEVSAPAVLWVAPYLPEGITDGLVVPVTLERTEQREAADLLLKVGGENPVTHLVYALAAPFPTTRDEVSLEAVKQVWGGQAAPDVGLNQLIVSEAGYRLFSAWWGEAGENTVGVLKTPEDILAYTWTNRTAWALVPFEELGPRWKVMRVDAQSPLWKDFDPGSYALNVPVSLVGENPELTGQVAAAFQALLPLAYNRDPDKLTTVAVTGVTALVRATAWEMETKGITYPAEDVGPLLRKADITHISNEVPFVEGCAYPDPGHRGLVFCSDPKYIELLETVGTDVVELTGDHFADWGDKATLYTFGVYREKGWPFYGAGETLEEGRKPITLVHNGNNIAFIGCNAKGLSYTPAVSGRPGAVDCDDVYMHAEIRRLVAEGYVVITTFQHNEVYTFVPGPQLQRDFQGMAEAGAQIVSGSQAHQPHGMAFQGDSLIMWGLGNLFFDQVGVSEDTARAMIARHVIYDGRYISTEVFTVRFLDYSRPRYMEAEDRLKLLTDVFTASGW